MMWKKFEEEAPKEGLMVLVLNRVGRPGVGWFYGDRWYVGGFRTKADYVLYWMPFPKLPWGEDTNE